MNKILNKKELQKRWDIFFSEQREKIVEIKIANEYIDTLNYWANTKYILDSIKKPMPKFGEVLKLSKQISGKVSPETLEWCERNNGFIITLDSNKLTKEQESYFVPSLRLFEYMGIIGYKDYNYKKVFYDISQNLNDFLHGKLLIRNKENFVNFYNKFEEFYSFIEKYGAKNFPKQYSNFSGINEYISEKITNNYNKYNPNKTKVIVKEYNDIEIWDDNSITIQNKSINLEPRFNKLLIYFVNKPERNNNFDDIKDAIGRSALEKNTISKYISAINKSLKKYFKKRIITSSGEDCWKLEI